MKEDWIDLTPVRPEPVEGATGSASRHLDVLRGLLARDYLARADWNYALADLAEMVRAAVSAQQSLVALWTPEDQSWFAVASGGKRLRDAEIQELGSRSVLERVRETEEPVLAVGPEGLDLQSESIERHSLRSFLVVPLYFWDPDGEQPERRFGGCLYAHRITGRKRFTPEDVEILLDIARIAQPTLNALRAVARVEKDLAASRSELERLRQAAARDVRFGSFETQDPWFAKSVLEPLQRVKSADKVNLLLLGPTGSGKTRLAEAYHYECARRDGPFVVLDCAQVTSVETLGAELFGFAPDSGYANSPKKGRPGKAELADGGTLFIDEIGSLPADLQQKLLQILEKGTFSPLGSGETRRADFQVIAATNVDLKEHVRLGRFREDLFWRISDVVLTLPPLSDRAADVPLLAQHFLETSRERAGRRSLRGFDEGALRKLMEHDWSKAGNIRGLERTVLRSILLAPDGVKKLKAEHLSLQEIASAAAQPMAPHSQAPDDAAPRAPDAAPPSAKRRGQHRATPEVERVCAAIREHGYASAAAKALGISYTQLLWKLQKAGLSVRDVLLES